VQELTGLKDRRGVALGTGLTVGIPVLALLADHGATPAWRTYWGLFGASNQLLAALALLGVTVWLWRTRRETWIWPCVALPCAFMTLMSSWALVELVRKGDGPIQIAGSVLLALAVLMVLEGVASLRKPPLRLEPATA
jgi:carbon starvation protein